MTMTKDRLVPGEKRAKRQVCFSVDEVGGGLTDHAGGEQRRHLHRQRGPDGRRGVASRSFTACFRMFITDPTVPFTREFCQGCYHGSWVRYARPVFSALAVLLPPEPGGGLRADPPLEGTEGLRRGNPHCHTASPSFGAIPWCKFWLNFRSEIYSR